MVHQKSLRLENIHKTKKCASLQKFSVADTVSHPLAVVHVALKLYGYLSL